MISNARSSCFLALICFALCQAGASAKDAGQAKATPHDYDYFELRSGLHNSRAVFEAKKSGRVAFLGGSITTMDGWRGMTYKSLEKRFPDTRFDFVHAGIPSVDSTGDAFRLVRDVFGKGQVDLLFVEASVNDLHNGRDSTQRIRAMEGIVRQARDMNPSIDVVFLCFVDVPFIREFDAGKTPGVIADHLKVAEHYQIPSIDLAREVAERIRAGEFEWKKFRNCHPSPFGHALYHSSIERLFAAAWDGKPGRAATFHKMPTKQLDAKNYQRGRLVDLKAAKLGAGWKLDEKWSPKIKAGTRAGFVRVPMLVAEEVGATLDLEFEGTAVGLFVVAGPDSGDIEFSIDGGETKKMGGFTRWSGGLYLPWAYVLDADLEPGRHRLELKVAGSKHAKSKGNAIRIAHFLVN